MDKMRNGWLLDRYIMKLTGFVDDMGCSMFQDEIEVDPILVIYMLV